MFDSIFTKAFYGNTIIEWLMAAGLAILSIMFAKFVYMVIGKFFKKLTSRTDSQLDDILVDMLEEPLVFALIIFGIWYSLQTLTLSTAIQDLVENAYYMLIIFDVAWLLVRIIDALIERYVVPFAKETESKFDDQLLPLLRKSIKASIWIIAVLVALNNAGYNVGAIIASLGIGGLAFALAAKDTVANLFGSLTIFLDEPFEIGDRVKVNGFDGFVEEIGIRSTRLRTLTGRLVTMSNSSIANASIENISSEPNRKVTLDLGLTYDTSAEQMQRAMDILQEIILSDEDLEDEAVTAFTAFNDFALNIRLIYYIRKEAPIFESQTKVNMAILKRFNEEKLEFAFPTQTIFANIEK
jgi:MscS family membrane protein